MRMECGCNRAFAAAEYVITHSAVVTAAVMHAAK